MLFSKSPGFGENSNFQSTTLVTVELLIQPIGDLKLIFLPDWLVKSVLVEIGRVIGPAR